MYSYIFRSLVVMAAKVITLLIVVAGGAISLIYWASKIQGMFAS